jgi:hypothetical protein
MGLWPLCFQAIPDHPGGGESEQAAVQDGADPVRVTGRSAQAHEQEASPGGH